MRLAEIRNARIALRTGDSVNPVAHVRADKIRQDHQKRGFFKIGFLPLVVIENLSIQVSEGDGWRSALPELPRNVPGEPGLRHALQARGFELTFSGCPGGSIRAETAHWDPRGGITLMNGTVHKPGSAVVRFKRGEFKLTGTLAGTFEFSSAFGATRIRLPDFFGPTIKTPI